MRYVWISLIKEKIHTVPIRSNKFPKFNEPQKKKQNKLHFTVGITQCSQILNCPGSVAPLARHLPAVTTVGYAPPHSKNVLFKVGINRHRTRLVFASEHSRAVSYQNLASKVHSCKIERRKPRIKPQDSRPGLPPGTASRRGEQGRSATLPLTGRMFCCSAWWHTATGRTLWRCRTVHLCMHCVQQSPPRAARSAAVPMPLGAADHARHSTQTRDR